MNEDNKQPNKFQNTQTGLDVFNVSNLSIFKDNSSVIYIYKKTEKLVSAIYLLSNFISDKEPLKWQMRESGIELLSQSLTVTDRTGFLSKAIKNLSFFEIAFLGGIISEMNYKILKFEFESLIQTVESAERTVGSKNLLFSEHFFDTASTNAIPKGQDTMSFKLSDKKEPPKLKDKNTRQEIIMSLLKKNKELGIKDFVSSISDCSEKTIQRELALLVSNGSIKKEGEKRWSRYSIKG
jgi:predicted transcriptional regulator